MAKRKDRLEKLLAKTRREYNVSLNEENYQAIILEEIESPPSLLDYFRAYMRGNEVTLEWGCLMLLFMRAEFEKDVHALERYYRFLGKYPPHYFTEFVMAKLELTDEILVSNSLD